MTIPRRLNTIFRIGLFALYFSFLPAAYSADVANSPAVISGVSSGNVTKDVDPDGDNLLEASGKLNITDRDAGESAFKPGTRIGKYGNLSINTTGQWNYAAQKNQAAIQALGAGDKLTDTIKVSSIDGTTHNVIISIHGANDVANSPAVIGGVSSGNVTKDVDPDGDNWLEVGAKLNITDRDAGESAFKPGTRIGKYGNLSINTTGQWNYAAQKNQAAIQALGAGDKLTDTIKVSSIDGTTHNVIISIHGANDVANSPAVIGGVSSGNVTKDVDPDGDNLLEASGKLNITDRDAGESAFKPGTRIGKYGNLSINTTGQWNYAAQKNQAAIQALGAGDKLTDTIKVSSIDGSTRNVIISIHGVNDVANSPAVIGGINSGSVTEDVDPDGDNLLEVGRKLNITDRDAGQSAFKARTHIGKYGNLSIKTTGQWNYAARKNQTAIQALAAGKKLTDTIKVSSLDGTTRSVIISIHGANDAAKISGVSIGSVTEDVDPDGDNLLEVGRKLNITDKDAGEAAFKARTHKGKYGNLRIQAAGLWRYTAEKNQAAIQALGVGDKLTDTFKVSSIDGTTHNVIISIKGANDAASSSGVNNGGDNNDVVNSGGAKGSGDLTISWIAPVEREDGTAISMSEIASYRVYYGISQGDYTREIEINNSSTMNVTLSNLKSGTYYIVVTSIDWDGRESAFSQEVSKSI